MCVSSVGFAWDVLRGVLGEYAFLLLSKLMHLQYSTMSSIFDLEVRRLGMRDTLRHARKDNGLRIWIFSQKLPFSVEKNVSKTNLGSTIHYTYTSYNK